MPEMLIGLELTELMQVDGLSDAAETLMALSEHLAILSSGSDDTIDVLARQIRKLSIEAAGEAALLGKWFP